jgi:hypothetical protein
MEKTAAGLTRRELPDLRASPPRRDSPLARLNHPPQGVLRSIHFVPLRDDFRSFSFLLIFLFRQVLGNFPNEND